MQRSKPTGAPISAEQPWIDPDDAPESSEEFFKQADIYKGNTLIRQGPSPPHW